MLLELQGNGPLYMRVYSTLRQRIVDGRLGPGERLPGTRSVASALGVSRTVVLLAYSQLESEGYTTTRVGSGTYVTDARVLDDRPRPAVNGAAATEAGTVPDPKPHVPSAPLSRLATRVPQAPLADRPLDLLDSAVGVVDLTGSATSYDAQGMKAWRRSLSRTMAEMPPNLPGVAGALPLREAMLDYLGRERGVVADVDDIIIVNSAQQARDLIARVLVDEHTVVGVEDPCNPGIRRAFVVAGGQVVPCPVREGGLDVARGDGKLDKAQVLHVAPACHVPSGISMSETHREALLQWAYERPAWIVEEDLDGDRRHGVRVTPALQGADRHGRVIYYLNNLAHAVYPALPMSCVVVPPSLREKFRALKSLSDHDDAAVRQHAWASHIANGEHARSLRRLSQQLSQKHRVLVDALHRHLGSSMNCEGTAATGRLLVHLPGLEASWMTMLREEALRIGLLLQSAGDWYAGARQHVTLMLRYAAVPEDLMDVAARRLAHARHIALRDVAGSHMLRTT